MKNNKQHISLAFKLATKYGMQAKVEFDKNSGEASIEVINRERAQELREVFEGYNFTFTI